jgi:Prophage minor tail protein Z (GPZ).
MTINIDVRSNTKDIIKGLNKFERQFVPQAMARSLNEVGRRVNAKVRRSVADDTGLKVRDLGREFITLSRARRNRLRYIIRYLKGAVPLKAFNPSQGKNGVTVRGAWGETQMYPGAFIVDKLGRHVFKRTSEKRLPIRKMYGPIPAREAASEKNQRLVQAIVDKELPDKMRKNLNFFIKRALGSIKTPRRRR